MLAAFGRSLSMDRGEEDQETGNLLHFHEDDEAEETTTLTEAAAVALKNAKVQEMLAAFRTEGPQALQRFVDDPACSDALDVLRGQSAGVPQLTGVVPQSTGVVPRPGEPVVTGSIVEDVSTDGASIVVTGLEPAEVLHRAAPIAAEGLEKPRVREMLEAFRSEGPAALERFAGDPDCAGVIARLRGVAPPPPKRAPPATRRPRVLLGATGSVATVKVPQLAMQLRAFADVRVVCTTRGRFFLEKARTYDEGAFHAFEAARIEVLSDDDEWARWTRVGDPVLHVDLREWADVLLIAPLGANTLAKLATGLCDDLLSCTARAWDVEKPVVVAPAMNTAMWDHPLTAHHLAALLVVYGSVVVAPVAKALACGDVGVGARADVDDVVAATRAALGLGPVLSS